MNGATFRVPSTTIEVLRAQLEASYKGEPTGYGDDYMSDEHRETLAPMFQSLMPQIVRVQTHLSKRTEKNSQLMPGGRWLIPFPHDHQWPHSYTIITYLQAPEGGGEFVWFDRDGVTEHVVPVEAGLAVACDGWCKHGVLPIKGERERVAIITTAWSQ